jgi:hypothetical protein
MSYAVNIADLTLDNIVATFMVAPLTTSHTIVNTDSGHPDEAAVLFDCCDSDAADIVATIRLRYPAHVLRCYQSSTGQSWKRV